MYGWALGIPGDWGKKAPVPTTIFPQAIGMAATWDPELLQEAAGIEGLETRYIFQNRKWAFQKKTQLLYV